MVRPQLDQLAAEQVIELLLDAEARVVPTVRRATPEIAKAAEILASAVFAGDRVVFTGAGASGRLAAAEAAELPGTFGTDPARCIAAIPAAVADDSAEDDAAAGAALIDETSLRPGDVLIAVAASGQTPFTLAAASQARAAGAAVIAVVNAPGSPLAALATVAVEIVVGAEILRGSTRMTAGTAQKIALNALTTAAMARAGRVHDDLMIDVVAANTKLRERAVGIVAEIAGCSSARAEAALLACDDNARAAVLHLVRELAPADAIGLAAAHPSLRAALESCGGPQPRPAG
jgi:N-acetylmuramic acid 6-phosphate etherase